MSDIIIRAEDWDNWAGQELSTICPKCHEKMTINVTWGGPRICSCCGETIYIYREEKEEPIPTCFNERLLRELDNIERDERERQSSEGPISKAFLDELNRLRELVKKKKDQDFKLHNWLIDRELELDGRKEFVDEVYGRQQIINKKED